MSNRLFQGVIHQMKDAIDRVIGVIDENLKNTDPLKWTGLMNNYKHYAEEIVFKELIYV